MVSEWTFQKDGTDVEMRDISNDTKSAQLDSRDTFLGIGQNRCLPAARARSFVTDFGPAQSCWWG